MNDETKCAWSIVVDSVGDLDAGVDSGDIPSSLRMSEDSRATTCRFVNMTVYGEASLLECGNKHRSLKSGQLVHLLGTCNFSSATISSRQNRTDRPVSSPSLVEFRNISLCGPPITAGAPFGPTSSIIVDQDTFYHSVPLRTWLEHHFRLGVEHTTVYMNF